MPPFVGLLGQVARPGVYELVPGRVSLGELIEQLAPGDAIVITRGEQPLAVLVPPAQNKPQPQFGSCKGMLTILSEDNEHLEHFKGYMP